MVFSLVYFSLYFLVFLCLLFFWVFRFKGASGYTYIEKELPKVSILIAARNEEANIINCLTAIDQLDYPKDKLEVLVGDDRSQDATMRLVQEFIIDKPYIQLVSIKQDLGGIKGKANVLAQLARLATSGYYFFTDADIEVPAAWIATLLSKIKGKTAIVTGITTVKGNRWFYRMQQLDWLYSLGLMQVVADRGLAVSTMGNNMVITREAYEAVGGFEGIPFSITEDVQLLKHVLQKDYSSSHVYDASALALSMPALSLLDLLHQRKRWMSGAKHLPWYMWTLFVFSFMYYPIWVPFFWYTSIGAAVLIGLLKVGLQSIFIKIAVARAGKTVKWMDLLSLEVYLVSISILLIVFYFLPFKITWKGRQY